MGIVNDAVVRFESFSGKAEVEYEEAEGRFTIRKKAGNSGVGVAAGMMFGVLGRMLVNEVMSGKEIGSFTAAEIAQVKVSTATRQVVYYLYPMGSTSPYEITIDSDTFLNTTIKKVFADRIVDIVAKPGNANAPQKPAAVPQSPAPSPAAPPVQSPVKPPVTPPVQPPVTPPVQYSQPPVAPPVQPQAAAPAQPASSTIAMPAWQSAIEEVPGTVPVAPPVFAKPANALLCLRTGPLAGNNFQCAPGYSVTIGRDPSRCSLVLSQYPNVSTVHCRMDIGDHYVTVTDLNSSNGTFVNGARLVPGQPTVVRAGGMVKLATDACTFLIYFEK